MGQIQKTDIKRLIKFVAGKEDTLNHGIKYGTFTVIDMIY